MSALLEIAGLSSAYGQSRVLWDVDLALERGQVMALIGRNGVGKTTLLHTIMGTRPVTGGTLHFDGRDMTAMPAHGRARAGIGFVPQGRHVFPQLTVMENLETGLSALAGRGKRGAKVPQHIFDLFPKLWDIRGRAAGFLSGGEQQQLAIGRALAGEPSLLLLDEPTEGIQPNVVQQIEAALVHVRDELGMTVLVVEQYLDFVWRFADRYCAMQNGRIIRQGAIADESAKDVAHLVQI
ncbi:urea ABC transporter ATP-binding subunit UrtE [Sphingobium sp. Ant17]|jgi:urea transport system ATP-binding protein|uniref:urea ABC transporter ATP-binding subunit UrtE n=1 Tax=Sphingobium sp. Ant17 TaxID=1461752 RepID=UPI000449CB0B|nr:urea ABC transporter ATP-binding subunit UrtE [Sphingobium sp. Ant17]EXS71962.1 urea ABC transporter ATP-binding protein [Sphingobium sp. Ant17]|tara:strand:+ start:6353 stop:7066 length:714 start_codon:yes stop_codon:yes gene_type:complete